MDKKEARVIRKGMAFSIILIFIALISGCETLKGAYAGAKKDLESAKQIDEWMRKNLW